MLMIVGTASLPMSPGIGISVIMRYFSFWDVVCCIEDFLSKSSFLVSFYQNFERMATVSETRHIARRFLGHS